MGRKRQKAGSADPWAAMARRGMQFRAMVVFLIPFYLLMKVALRMLGVDGVDWWMMLYVMGLWVSGVRVAWAACPACGLPFYVPSIWNIARTTCTHCGVAMGSPESAWPKRKDATD